MGGLDLSEDDVSTKAPFQNLKFIRPAVYLTLFPTNLMHSGPHLHRPHKRPWGGQAFRQHSARGMRRVELHWGHAPDQHCDFDTCPHPNPSPLPTS